MSIAKPKVVGVARAACPVCGKVSYSQGGVHPQCAVTRADTVARKARKAKAAAVAARPVRQMWTKRCTACGRQVAARRFVCDCGKSFQQTSGG